MEDHQLDELADDQYRRPRTLAQQPDGSWAPAVPIGWQEEHGRFACWLLLLLGRGHCGQPAPSLTDRAVAASLALSWAAFAVLAVALVVDAVA